MRLRTAEHVHQTALADRQTEQIGKRPLEPFVGQCLESLQIGRDRMDPRAERRPLRRVRQRSRHPHPARWAANRQPPVALHDRRDRRQFDPIVLADRLGGPDRPAEPCNSRCRYPDDSRSRDQRPRSLPGYDPHALAFHRQAAMPRGAPCGRSMAASMMSATSSQGAAGAAPVRSTPRGSGARDRDGPWSLESVIALSRKGVGNYLVIWN